MNPMLEGLVTAWLALQLIGTVLGLVVAIGAFLFIAALLMRGDR